MAFKLPVLNVSSSDSGITIPGLTKIEWSDVTEKCKLGEGSFGEVYSARVQNKVVVVKKLRRQKKQKERDLFAKEVRILSGLRCRHIVGVEGYCSNPVAVILEYVYFDFKPLGFDGDRITSLNEYLDFLCNGEVVYQLAFLQQKIALDVVTAVDYLHNRNIVHRDIKLRNVLVSNTHYCHLTNPHEIEQAWLKEGIVCKLADFGESRSSLHQTATINHTRTTNLQRGTLVYNPPEAVVTTKKFSYSLEELKYGDIWSLGMVLFMLMNPDLEFPYSKELEDEDVECPSEARNVIGKLMDEGKKPAHSVEFDSFRVAQWSYINEAYELCTFFEPSQRASAHDVLTVLCQGNLKKANKQLVGSMPI